jgi:multidrug efflux system membrane fusion protein
MDQKSDTTTAPLELPESIRRILEDPRTTRLTGPFRQRHTRRYAIAGLAALVAIAWWVARHHSPSGANAYPAAAVTVQTLREQNVRLWSEFSGRLQAVDSAEIRPEVGGRITEVRFEDGQYVHQGDVLFVIDPEPYKAALSRAEANAEFAKTEFARAAGLVQSQAIAQRVYDERAMASRVADAELVRARVDYNRAYVKAPISGRAGRAELTVGNLVQTTPNAPLLTTIVSNRNIYADFEVDEQTYLDAVHDGAVARQSEQTIPVELTIPSETRIYRGQLSSFDNHIDTVSGTIRARAKFPNPDGTLLPGMFVSVKIGSEKEKPVLLVPERAIGVDQNKKFVYTVGSDNKVAYREVSLGGSVESERVVLTGLKAGDRVIVDGTLHVRPDMMVAPTEKPAAIH